MTERRTEIVSDDSELLILVDEQDNALGELDKASCHDGFGRLHRAFSVFIFNDQGELLLQQRAEDKRLWPSFWSNSCCSHPRVGEAMDVAIQRRCEQELGMSTDLRYVYKFKYQASFKDLGSEHELCSVYVGQYSGQLDINHSEIMDYRWLSPEVLDAEMAASPEQFTPWFAMEWDRLKTEFKDLLPVPA